MKKKTKYRLMSAILAGSLFISGFKSLGIKTNAAELEYEQTPELTEYINSFDNSQTRKFFRELYKLYDFESFHSRSSIPLYFQSIYGEKFSVGTIQSAGCGITSLGMVASYLFDEIITPDLTCRYDSGPSPAAAFEKGIKKLGLNCEKISGVDASLKLDEYLKNGHPIIALMGPSSYFTNTGHFIVIAGITEDGKYIINDPNIENYYKENMIEGFTNGFPKEMVTQGLRGIYVFDTKEQFIDRRQGQISIK